MLPMLIVIAGLIGTGKTTIAKALSARLEIPLCSIDEEKERVYRSHPEYRRHVDEGVPFPDDLRKQAFDATLDKLRALAKTHRHAVVEETFHKRHLREPFLNAAAALFGGKCVIFVTADDVVIRKRLNERKEHMAGVKMYEAFRKVFEPFAKVDYTVENNGMVEESIENATEFVKAHLD